MLFAPRDLRTTDADVAQDMAAGIYVFGDRTMRLGRDSPFATQPPSEDWTAELYGFGWLRHLRAADTGPARDMARMLVASAFGAHRREFGRGVARRPAVVARRVISLLAHSPLLMSGADHSLYRAYLGAIGRDAAALERDMREAPVPLERLVAAIGLCFAGLCCQGLDGRLRRAIRALSLELDAQILADGGHVSRNPGILLDLLLDLLPLRLLFGSRSVEIPPALDRAVDRMMPMLRFFRHGDGELALFNGMGRTSLGDLATILSLDPDRGAPALHAARSGYDRVEAGRTLVIVDTGPAPPLAASGAAHAGCLSFELSRGQSRIVVNCGAPSRRGPARDAARLTAAHSTLVLDEVSSGDALSDETSGWAASYLHRRLGPVLLSGPRSAGGERGTTAAGDEILSGHHDGYGRLFGATHVRRLRLAADGAELAGEDTLSVGSGRSPEGHAARLRFHLHPGTGAEPAESGSIRLHTSGGERWLFDAEGGSGPPRLEDSIFFAVSEGRRATRQIVVDLPLGEGASRPTIRWRFRLAAGE
ncbi:heparinase II/III family protein [uncultured Enterovirga sp.]|uniref:heparinase II/III family protein n=1 Tax=uncultured Enterovirga sp. TaxID=2026352 RepID=UPI0035CB5955